MTGLEVIVQSWWQPCRLHEVYKEGSNCCLSTYWCVCLTGEDRWSLVSIMWVWWTRFYWMRGARHEWNITLTHTALPNSSCPCTQPSPHTTGPQPPRHLGYSPPPASPTQFLANSDWYKWLVHPKPHCTCAHTVPLVGGRCHDTQSAWFDWATRTTLTTHPLEHSSE